MKEDFAEPIFRELDSKVAKKSGNIIKKEDFKVSGFAKISIEEESMGGVKFILKKDHNDVIKEIKFICSCGQSKSILLDYSE